MREESLRGFRHYNQAWEHYAHVLFGSQPNLPERFNPNCRGLTQQCFYSDALRILFMKLSQMNGPR